MTFHVVNFIHVYFVPNTFTCLHFIHANNMVQVHACFKIQLVKLDAGILETSMVIHKSSPPWRVGRLVGQPGVITCGHT
jgi:hypothetical protein